jgi:hypothetical protein
MVAEQTGTRSRFKVAVPRRKRRDTHVGTIEQLTGLDFGVRSDMHLGTLLERRNAEWLFEILQDELDEAEAGQDAAYGEPDEAVSLVSVETDGRDEADEAAEAA